MLNCEVSHMIFIFIFILNTTTREPLFQSSHLMALYMDAERLLSIANMSPARQYMLYVLVLAWPPIQPLGLKYANCPIRK